MEAFSSILLSFIVSLVVLGLILLFVQASCKNVEMDAPSDSSSSGDSDSSLDTDDDSANQQEGRRKRPCRCGECMTLARKRARRLE